MNAHARRRLIALPLLLALPALLAAGEPVHPHPSTLQAAPLEWKPPRTERVELRSGIVVHLLEDRQLPLVQAWALVGTGTVDDPPGKTGLADMTGTVLRTGGAGRLSGDELDETLEFLAASIEVSVYDEYSAVSLDVLSRDLDEGLRLLFDVLREPAFAQDKLDLARDRELEALRRLEDDPQELADIEWRKLVYGDDSPWARQPTPASLGGLSRDDLLAFHRQTYRPQNVLLAVAGDFRTKDLVRRLERLSKGWRGEAELQEVPAVEYRWDAAVHFIPKEITQTSIWMGHLSGKQFVDGSFNRDLYPLRVMDFILGSGGFTSRLTGRVRSDLGLAYSVGSRTGLATDYGTFFAYAITKSDTTHKAYDEMLGIIRGMTEGEVSAEELETARESLANTFVFRFDSPAEVVNRMALLEFMGFPKDYLETYVQRIRAVTAADVLRVARRYLHPDRLVVLLVGNPEAFDRPLSEWGAEVRERKLPSAQAEAAAGAPTR